MQGMCVCMRVQQETAGEGKEGQGFVTVTKRGLKQMQLTLHSGIQLCKLKLQACSRVASYLRKTSEVQLGTQGLACQTVSHCWSNRAF